MYAISRLLAYRITCVNSQVISDTIVAITTDRDIVAQWPTVCHARAVTYNGTTCLVRTPYVARSQQFAGAKGHGCHIL